MKLICGLVLFFCIVYSNAFSQTLTVNQNQLNFGNVFENNTDSMPVTISNSLGYDVTVYEIHFYNTYGIPAFSVSTSWFVIPDGSSATLYVRFSPRHNILHNSEMILENNSHRGAVAVNLTGQGKFSNPYYNLTENLAEENLKNSLNLILANGYFSLGYSPARDSMFMLMDNKRLNGQGASQNTIECVYTGREAVGYTDRTDCQTNFSFNTEHTFPQSFFSSMEPMRSDLHHLYPTDDIANGQRGDNPFGIVSSPTWNSGGSKSNGFTFEPRDQQKGQSARSLFYFVMRYQNYNNFLNSQENILRIWHNAFPPTITDKLRNEDIFSWQNNRNPFVDYPVFVERITSLSTFSSSQILNSIDIIEDTIVYGILPPSTPVIYNFVVMNNGNQAIQFSNFNLTHTAQLSFISGGIDTTIAPGDALQIKIRCETTSPDSLRAFLTFNTNATGNLNVSIPIFVNDLIYTTISETVYHASIFPIPAKDNITVSCDCFVNKTAYTLFAINGQLISSGFFNAKEHSINLQGVSSGVYFLKLDLATGTLVKKVIVQ